MSGGTLVCGHPQEALEYGGQNKGDPVQCGWCHDLARVREEADARAARVVRLFAEVAHEQPGLDWGVDGHGIHDYAQNDPRGCPVCEALDEVLGDARRQYDVVLTPEQREGIREFRDSGMLWLVNTAVMHPRGYAIAVTVAEDGTPLVLSVVGDGTEPWCFDSDSVESFHAHVITEQVREQVWSRLMKRDSEEVE